MVTNLDDVKRSPRITVLHELILYTETVLEETYHLAPLGDGGGANAVTVSDIPDVAGHHIVTARVGQAEDSFLWTVTTDSCDSLRITVESGRPIISAVDQPTFGSGGTSPNLAETRPDRGQPRREGERE